MGTSWRAWCSGPRLQLDGDDVLVTFDNGRKHRVRVQETDDTFEMHAVVARAPAVASVTNLALRVWLRNRSSQLVGFRIDARGAVRAQGWVSKAGLTAGEFQHVVRHVAAESDRLEYILTGKDVE